MLPGKDGFAVASSCAPTGHYVPILMLTARSRPEDVLHGFEAGADDYLPKPFELQILLARLRGLAAPPRMAGAGSTSTSRSRSPGRRSTSKRSSCTSATRRIS